MDFIIQLYRVNILQVFRYTFLYPPHVFELLNTNFLGNYL